MCGIAGAFAFTSNGLQYTTLIKSAIQPLNKRGPDCLQSVLLNENKVALGHARLSIIDTSESANQPMFSTNGKFCIVFNGEIYNFKALRKDLEKNGVTFQTHCDTEVIVELYAAHGKKCVEYLNGFFAFAIWDIEKKELFVTRDRLGIKPLLFNINEDAVIFSSEMKSLVQFDFEKELNYTSLKLYFQLNYIPFPSTIFKGVYKLEPGSYMLFNESGLIEKSKYYTIPLINDAENNPIKNYKEAQNTLYQKLEKSVNDRLVSDVPLGSFLSGGVDSSVIAMLAAKHKPDLQTFSVGFTDNPYFDETVYANTVAEKIKSNHTVFSLSNNDLYENLSSILDYIDEPFADSSAIPVFILSKLTRQKVTVALSGDGADEMFGGYNKHYAEWKVRQKSLVNSIVSIGAPIWDVLPKSRHSKFGNLFRQLDRFAAGSKLSSKERYWRWCSFADEDYGETILKNANKIDQKEYEKLKSEILTSISENGGMNQVLHTDLHLVLVNDMLTKVDLMSMANSLEVRVPFLDHNVINYAASLPAHFKVDEKGRKKILKDTFRKDLPQEIFDRNKMGFEVPLLQWFRTDLKELIVNDLLSESFIESQDIFEYSEIKKLKNQLFSNNPEEVHAKIWALIVFQSWWKKYMA